MDGGGAKGRLGKTSHECKRQRKILPRSKDNKLLIFIGLEIPAAPAAATGYKREKERGRGMEREGSEMGWVKDKAKICARLHAARVYFSLGLALSRVLSLDLLCL